MYVPSQGTPVNQMMITSDAESLGTQQVQDFPTIAAPSTTSICNETISPSSAAKPAPEITYAEHFSSVQLTSDDLDTSNPSSAYSTPSSSYAQVPYLPFFNQAAMHPGLAAPTVQAIDPSASHVQVPAPNTPMQEKKSRKGTSYDAEVHCNICNRKFAGQSNFRQHVHQKHHQGTRPFRCTICGKSYLTEQNMLEHRRNHDPSMKPYKCQSCEKSYRHVNDRVRHFERHHGTMPYVCVIEGCSKAFTRRDNLRRHLNWHEGQIRRQRNREEERVMSQQEKNNRKGREE
ncbi:hypothetical protein RP20_CCG006084 [Aedes albopictus]|nr:hypothetical protein RP20_CCG006084 [Aedes albopictus]